MLKKLKTNKVNRLSIGVQSFNKKILKTLGREYNEIDKILLAKKYFKNINCDLIYGVKTQTLEELRNDLKTFLKLSIPHLSIYSLILEEHTKLFLGNYQEIDEDLNSDMYNLICKTLKENGYEHYEISNFAKKGYQSKHNLVYWNNEEYFGFGVGASGYINNIRYTNTRSIANYINKKRIVFKENIDLKKAMEYEIILGLRKIKGVNKLKFKEKYNKELKDIFFVGNLKSKGNYYFIPYDKLFVSNSILCDFILD